MGLLRKCKIKQFIYSETIFTPHPFNPSKTIQTITHSPQKKPSKTRSICPIRKESSIQEVDDNVSQTPHDLLKRYNMAHGGFKQGYLFTGELVLAGKFISMYPSLGLEKFDRNFCFDEPISVLEEKNDVRVRVGGK